MEKIVYTDISTLEKELSASAHQLYALSNSKDMHYKKVKIPKKSGGHRTLFVPDHALKTVQRSILNDLLYRMPSSPYACAYEFGKSLCDSASHHIGKKYLMKLDIKSFFDSISYASVKNVFSAEHFSEPLRILLASLCYYRESLPQGAPTSPKIANLVLYGFDMRVGSECRKRGITYTRYCDDMAFSTDISREVLCDMLKFVKNELYREHLYLNPEKTVICTNSSRMCVTGVVVNEKASVKREYLKELRRDIYYCKKFGVADHLKKLGEDIPPEEYIRKLYGRVAFVLSIDKDNKEAARYKKQILELRDKNGT